MVILWWTLNIHQDETFLTAPTNTIITPFLNVMSNSTVPTPKLRVIALILAGGQGSRMGGQNKGLIQYKNKALISHVIDRLKPQVDDIVINCNADLEAYRHFGYPIATDQPITIHDLAPTIERQELLGPLQGVLSSYETLCKIAGTKPTYVFICPCDTPQLPLNLIERLLFSALHNTPDDDDLTDSLPAAITPCIGSQIEPLASLVSLTQIPSILGYLQGNGRSVTKWLKTIDTRYVSLEDVGEGFMNLNRIEDLA